MTDRDVWQLQGILKEVDYLDCLRQSGFKPRPRFRPRPNRKPIGDSCRWPMTRLGWGECDHLGFCWSSQGSMLLLTTESFGMTCSGWEWETSYCWDSLSSKRETHVFLEKKAQALRHSSLFLFSILFNPYMKTLGIAINWFGVRFIYICRAHIWPCTMAITAAKYTLHCLLIHHSE